MWLPVLWRHLNLQQLGCEIGKDCLLNPDTRCASAFYTAYGIEPAGTLTAPPPHTQSQRPQHSKHKRIPKQTSENELVIGQLSEGLMPATHPLSTAYSAAHLHDSDDVSSESESTSWTHARSSLSTSVAYLGSYFSSLSIPYLHTLASTPTLAHREPFTDTAEGVYPADYVDGQVNVHYRRHTMPSAHLTFQPSHSSADSVVLSETRTRSDEQVHAQTQQHTQRLLRANMHTPADSSTQSIAQAIASPVDEYIGVSSGVEVEETAMDIALDKAVREIVREIQLLLRLLDHLSPLVAINGLFTAPVVMATKQFQKKYNEESRQTHSTTMSSPLLRSINKHRKLMARQREQTDLSPQAQWAQSTSSYHTSTTRADDEHSLYTDASIDETRDRSGRSAKGVVDANSENSKVHIRDGEYSSPTQEQNRLHSSASRVRILPSTKSSIDCHTVVTPFIAAEPSRKTCTGDKRLKRSSMSSVRRQDSQGGMQRWTGHDPILNIDPISHANPDLKIEHPSSKSLRRNQTESDVRTKIEALTRSPLHTEDDAQRSRRPASVQAQHHTDTNSQSEDEVQFNRPHLRTDGVMDMATLTALRNRVDMHARRLKTLGLSVMSIEHPTHHYRAVIGVVQSFQSRHGIREKRPGSFGKRTLQVMDEEYTMNVLRS